MDEKDKKIKELEDQLKEANKKIEDSKGREDKLKALETDKAELARQLDVAKKDAAGARHKYKKLSEMTETEKELLTEKEREIMARQEDVEKQQEELRVQREEDRKKEVASRKSTMAKEIAGDDKDLYEKIILHYDSFKDSEKASTPEEIATIMTKAAPLAGVTSVPDAVSQAAFTPGMHKDSKAGPTSFAETEDGKGLASKLNLNIALEENKDGGEKK